MKLATSKARTLLLLGSILPLIVESFGSTYAHEVRESRLHRPDDSRIIRHEEMPWLTLITCQGYDEQLDTYRWRRVVRAVLIDAR